MRQFLVFLPKIIIIQPHQALLETVIYQLFFNSLGKVWEWLVTTDDRPENMGQIIERK